MASHTERWYFSPLKMDEGLVQKVCVRVCVYIYRYSLLITRKRQLTGKIGPQKGLKWQKTKPKKDRNRHMKGPQISEMRLNSME